MFISRQCVLLLFSSSIVTNVEQIQSSECKSPESFASWQIYKEGKKHFHQSLNVADNPLPTFTVEEHCKNQGCKESIPLPGRRWGSLCPCSFQYTQFRVSRSQHPQLQEQQVIYEDAFSPDLYQ